MSDTILSNHWFLCVWACAHTHPLTPIGMRWYTEQKNEREKERKKRVHNDDEDATTKDDVAAKAMLTATQDNVHMQHIKQSIDVAVLLA